MIWQGRKNRAIGLASLGLALLVAATWWIYYGSPQARFEREYGYRGGSTKPLTVEESLGSAFSHPIDSVGHGTAAYSLCPAGAAPAIRKALTVKAFELEHGNFFMMLGWVGDAGDVEQCRAVLLGEGIGEGPFTDEEVGIWRDKAFGAMLCLAVLARRGVEEARELLLAAIEGEALWAAPKLRIHADDQIPQRPDEWFAHGYSAVAATSRDPQVIEAVRRRGERLGEKPFLVWGGGRSDAMDPRFMKMVAKHEAAGVMESLREEFRDRFRAACAGQTHLQRPFTAEDDKAVAELIKLVEALDENVAPVRSQPDERAAELDDVFEALFRYQFSHNASAAGDSAKAFFLSIKGEDPDAKFLARFSNHSPSVTRGTEFKVGDGIKLRIDSWVWRSADEIELTGGYYAGNLSSSGNRYLLVRKWGAWIVVKDQMTWIS